MSETEQKYDVLEKIGHGSFGVIRKVRRREDGMVLCRKEISYLKMSQKEREQLHAEFQILSTLRHANIVGYYHREHLKVTQDLHLYMEYCGNGDLGRVIRELSQKNQYAEESFVWSIFAQLVTALYRCHYGVDPPEVGKNVLGLGNAAKPKVPAGGVTILHRDLKPENVFLGEDNSVKLGDFGLAKMIQSHDFASTYVGTPFYMSPEICAAEKYTLKSDIWSLGCIMYELCAREPPFNAKSHYQLVQKIKEGKLAPLPVVYSPELCTVVRDCLKVNPDRRPDTATLLNLPVVRLMRKEKEVVEMSRVLKAKEEQLGRRVRELERKMEADKQQLRQDLDASMRREWEVKARLEIDRLVNAELDHLQKKFEQEVRARVEAELLQAQKKMAAEAEAATAAAVAAAAEAAAASAAAAAAAAAYAAPMSAHPRLPPPSTPVDHELSSSVSKSEYNMHSSLDDFDGDGEFPSTTDITDITELSVDESASSSFEGAAGAGGAVLAAAAAAAAAPAVLPKRHNAPVPQARTPFGRAQTMFAGTPMDIEMASPSPMAIASLSLSPRRNAATKAPTANSGNIFAAPAAGDDLRWQGSRETLSDWDSDDEAGMPSPTRLIKSRKNLFTSKKTTQSQQQQQQSQQQQQQQAGGSAARPGSIPAQKTGGLLFSRPRSKGPEAGTRTALTGATTATATTTTASSSTASAAAVDGLRMVNSSGGRCDSPGRRLSKIPSVANLGAAATAAGSTAAEGLLAVADGGVRVLARKTSFNHRKDGEAAAQSASSQQQQQQQQLQQQPLLSHGLVSKQKPGIRGRTLVELQQARAGGRPMSMVVDGSGSGSGSSSGSGTGFGGFHGLSGGNMSPKRPFREHAAAANRGGLALESPAVWDPEQDEMPSPFLVRRKMVSVGPVAMGGSSSSSSKA